MYQTQELQKKQDEIQRKQEEFQQKQDEFQQKTIKIQSDASKIQSDAEKEKLEAAKVKVESIITLDALKRIGNANKLDTHVTVGKKKPRLRNKGEYFKEITEREILSPQDILDMSKMNKTTIDKAVDKRIKNPNKQKPVSPPASNPLPTYFPPVQVITTPKKTATIIPPPTKFLNLPTPPRPLDGFQRRVSIINNSDNILSKEELEKNVSEEESGTATELIDTLTHQPPAELPDRVRIPFGKTGYQEILWGPVGNQKDLKSRLENLIKQRDNIIHQYNREEFDEDIRPQLAKIETVIQSFAKAIYNNTGEEYMVYDAPKYEWRGSGQKMLDYTN